MKTDDLNLTVTELDKLCRLYMDCKLTVLEEKELEYVLCNTDLTSPLIEDVKDIMTIQLLRQPTECKRKPVFRNWMYISGIAACIAIILSVACYLTPDRTAIPAESDAGVYIAAYCHGERLVGTDAVSATNTAMAKADSLMNIATMAEHNYMMKANQIIDKTRIY